MYDPSDSDVSISINQRLLDVLRLFLRERIIISYLKAEDSPEGNFML